MGTNDDGSGVRSTADAASDHVDRRKLLGLLGAGSISLAGCLSGGDGESGDGGDGGGDDTTETDEDVTTAEDEMTTTEAGVDETDTTTASDETETEDADTTTDGDSELNCADLESGGYSRYDDEDNPFVATFEHPGNVAAVSTVNDTHSLSVTLDVSGNRFYYFPVQELAGTEEPTAAEKGEVEGLEQITEIEFNGETRPVIKAAGGSNGDTDQGPYDQYPYYVVGLPYEISAGKRYFRFQFQATAAFAEALEPTVCADVYETVALRGLESLEPNPDSTVEESGTD